MAEQNRASSKSEADKKENILSSPISPCIHPPEFVGLLQKQLDSKPEQELQTEESKQDGNGKQQQRRVKVKALKGSPYVISLEKADIVGEGSFGKVVRAYDLERKDEDLVAKIIPLGDALKAESLQMELKVLVKLPSHPNLVNYKKIKLSSQRKQYFIMDFCNAGTLTPHLNKKLAEAEIIDFLQQFARGYRVLYKSGIIHRDIKPDNILIHNRLFKIADFGLAKIVDPLVNLQNISIRGTPLYIAPELVKKEKSSAKVDMWSLGVILFRMLFKGSYPFLDPTIKYNVQTALRSISQNKLVIPVIPKRSDVLITLVKRMLEKDESKRISWEEFFEHELIAQNLRDEENEGANEENQNIYNNEGEAVNKNMLKSSVFLKRMEIVRQSKIKMTHLNQKVKKVKFSDDLENDSPDETTQLTREDKEETINEIDDHNNNNIKTDKKMRRKSEESATTKNTQNIPPNDDWVLASKKEIEGVIRASRRRLKSTESVKRAEDMLLVYREKILFLDMLCLRVSIIKQVAQKKLAKMEDSSSEKYIELDNFICILQKSLICLLEISLIYNEQLIKFHPVSGSGVTKEDWEQFEMSDNILLLQALLRQDKSCLNQFLQEERINAQQMQNQGHKLITSITKNPFELIKQTLVSLTSDTLIDILSDYLRSIRIAGVYLLDAICLIESNSDEFKNRQSRFEDFNNYYDFVAYYEEIEQQGASEQQQNNEQNRQQELFDELKDEIKKLFISK